MTRASSRWLILFAPLAALACADAAPIAADAATPEDAAAVDASPTLDVGTALPPDAALLAPDAQWAPDAAPPDASMPPDASAAGEDAAGFTFALITDLHVGEDISPKYSGEDYKVTQNLAAAVAKVNGFAAAEKISFVFATGDLTGSAETTEFQKARAVLDGLQVPWYPLLGNHDVWPYTDTSEASAPTGDATFVQVFGDKFAGVTHDFAAVWDPERSTTCHFINFEIRHADVVLLGLDWNTRKHALPTYKGSLPEGDLHDFAGGTFPWLEARLAALPAATKRVIFLQHHGFRTPAPTPAAGFTFTSDEGARFRAALEAAPPLPRYYGVFAGHTHRDYHGTAFDEWSWFAQNEERACKETGEVTLVRVGADGSVTVDPGH